MKSSIIFVYGHFHGTKQLVDGDLDYVELRHEGRTWAYRRIGVFLSNGKQCTFFVSEEMGEDRVDSNLLDATLTAIGYDDPHKL